MTTIGIGCFDNKRRYAAQSAIGILVICKR